MKGPYDDILTLPHHVSNKRAHMPRIDRAAQFAPFAALTGYDAAVYETARRSVQETESRNQGEVIYEEDSLFSDEKE